MKPDDYYQLLGVSRYASKAAIKHAFRQHIISVHPDRNPDDFQAAETARKLIEAYKVLSDPISRKYYDTTLNYVSTPTPAGNCACSSFTQHLNKTFVTVGVTVLVVFFALCLAQLILGRQIPVYEVFGDYIGVSDSSPEKIIDNNYFQDNPQRLRAYPYRLLFIENWVESDKKQTYSVPQEYLTSSIVSSRVISKYSYLQTSLITSCPL